MAVRTYTLAQAKAQFLHRFTCDHVPAWAKQPATLGRYYAPQFASDAEWFDNTVFPGEPAARSNQYCHTSGQTWPHGKWLGAPYVPGQPVVPYDDARRVGDKLLLSADYLQAERFHFSTDSQEIEAVCDMLGLSTDDVTGVLAQVGEGDYHEVWTTDSSRPWATAAAYVCRRVVQP